MLIILNLLRDNIIIRVINEIMTYSRFQFVPLVPAEFIIKLTTVSWREIDWAYQHGFFGKGMVVDFAKRKEKTVDEYELADLDKDHWWAVDDFLPKLIQDEPVLEEQEIADKWQYIILSYIYSHQEKFPNFLEKIEEIYTDFNYPKNMASFVRYNLQSDILINEIVPTTKEEYQQRLLDRLKEYLDAELNNFRADLQGKDENKI
jgi:hypothetical protein